MDLEEILKNEFVNFQGTFSIYINDFKGNVIKINENEEYNGASCIKIFILLELFNQIQEGKKDLKEKLMYTKSDYSIGSGIIQYLEEGLEMTVKDVATLMMIISDNTATNMLIEYLGIENINTMIKKVGCENTLLYSKFKYPEIKQFSKMTVEDYAKAFEYINNKIDSNIKEQIIEILKNQKYHEMIGDGIPSIYRKSDNNLLHYIITKSGKSKSLRNDGGIVSTKYGDYVISIFIKDFLDEYHINDESIYKYGKNISNIIFNRFIALQGKLK